MFNKGIGQKIVLFLAMIALGIGLLFGINYLAKDSKELVQDPIEQESDLADGTSPDDENLDEQIGEENELKETNEKPSTESEKPQENSEEKNETPSEKSSPAKQKEREKNNEVKEKRSPPSKQKEQASKKKSSNTEKPSEQEKPEKESSPSKESVEEQQPAQKKVSLTIVGSKAMGTILNTVEMEIQSSETVLDILQRTLKEKGIQLSVRGSGSTAYIEGINNLYEFDEGPGSGWMYSVNGLFPNRGAGVQSIKEGDHIEWRYTLDLGKDLGAGQ